MKQKKWIIDVGAFDGAVGKALSLEYGNDELPVLFIEPDPDPFSRIQVRGIDRKLNLAIAAFDGEIDFHYYQSGTHSVLRTDDSHIHEYIDGFTGKPAFPSDWIPKKVEKVSCRRLDSLCREMGIEYIRFLKIDTQGYDLEVIKSMGDMIHRVDELVCEVQLPKAQIYQGGASKEDILAYMHKSGFLFLRQKYQSYEQELNMYFQRKDLLGNFEKEPLVSIVTPCFNSARFVEKTIQSVIAQDYPYVEHIIQDGGSTDGTIEILKKYDGRIDWISEKDRGQADGLNRALQRCRGSIIGVLNADDEYLPHAARWAVEQFATKPHVAAVYGQQHNIDECGNIICTSYGPHPYSFEKVFLCDQVIPAQAAFIRRTALEAVGFYADASLATCPDYEMWVRLGLKFPMEYVDGVIANYRLHHGSEGQQEKIIHRMVEAKLSVIDKICSDPRTPQKIRRLRKRAFAGVYEWSAGHFLPPMLTCHEGGALRQWAKSFMVFPRSRTALKIAWSFFGRLLPRKWRCSDFFEAARVLRRIVRENLRRMDRIILGGFFYEKVYLPLKRKSD